MALRNLCVFCGSNFGSLPAYRESAQLLAQEILTRNLGLVYGGAKVGLMGEIANKVLAGGGKVVGVIPEQLVEKEVAHQGLSTLHITTSMHERKALMAELSDGFIALPGGIGTLEELFEIWTWTQLGLQMKPCGLLNVAGYYDLLQAFLDHAVGQSFIRKEHRHILAVDSHPGRLIQALEDFQPPQVAKWIGPQTDAKPTAH